MKLGPFLLLTFVLTVHAQYEINWSTIGGGGSSTGGVYRLNATIGPLDAGRQTGGAYTLTSGFWSIVAVIQTSGAPRLQITNSSGTLIVFWEGPATDFVLDATPTLSGAPVPWMQVSFPYQTNATDIFFTVPMPTGNRFYRLRKP